MGAEVTVFTHQEDKVADAKKMGATEVVLTTEKDWAKPCKSGSMLARIRSAIWSFAAHFAHALLSGLRRLPEARLYRLHDRRVLGSPAY